MSCSVTAPAIDTEAEPEIAAPTPAVTSSDAPLAPMPDAATLAERGEDVPPEEWRALAAGRTVWYSDAVGLWGRERYDPERDEVTFQFSTGECVNARWRHQGVLYCFDFGAGFPHCFRHMRMDGRLWVVGVQGSVQEVSRIDDSPVDCGPSPMS